MELESCGLAINIASVSHILKRVDFDMIALTHIIKSKAEPVILEQASTNRPVVWLKSCIAWQKFSATEQMAGDNNLQK